MMRVLKKHRGPVENTLMGAKVLLDYDELESCRYLRKRQNHRLPPLHPPNP